MLISNSHRFIYIHLHKCAGSSVEIALSATLAWDDILLGSTATGERMQKVYAELHPLYKHSTAAQVRNVIGAARWKDFHVFSTVRNPFSLAVSQYTYSLREVKRVTRKLVAAHREAGLPGTPKIPTTGWPWDYPGVRALRAAGPREATFQEFIRSPHLRGWTGFESMRPQLCDEDGRLLVDEVIRMEELPQRWPGLCARLGVGPLALGRQNASTGESTDWRAFYRSEEDVRIVREAFADDFAFFGYPETP